MRSYCLYNGNYADIAEIYEIRDGKQINIPEKLKYYRKLSDSRQLFCPCGCGEVVILVAGDRNLRKQHFRLLHKFENSCCKYKEESSISIKSKIMLKCWLNVNLPEMEHGIKYKVPISRLQGNKRRYELSMYSEDYDVGIIYNKYVSGIFQEKIELLSRYRKSNIIYVTRIENEETNGQYPEHMMRIQEMQGYCFYLNMTDESLYEEVEARVSIYEKSHDGFWKIVNVCDGKLDDFKLKEDGSLFYNGNLILDLVDKSKDNFQKEQKQELEKIRKNEEAEEQDIFWKKYPECARIYNLLQKLKCIKGQFFLKQRNGKNKNCVVEIEVNELKISKELHRIEIIKDNKEKVYIYILEGDFGKMENVQSKGVPYKVFDYRRMKGMRHHFETAVKCVYKDNSNGVECSVPEINCSHLVDNNICGCNTSCKYQKR